MFTAYIIIGIILAAAGFFVSLVGFVSSLGEDGTKEDARITAIVFSGTIILAPLWPAILALAFVVAFGYGLFCMARLAKHKDISFGEVSE